MSLGVVILVVDEGGCLKELLWWLLMKLFDGMPPGSACGDKLVELFSHSCDDFTHRGTQ